MSFEDIGDIIGKSITNGYGFTDAANILLDENTKGVFESIKGQNEDLANFIKTNYKNFGYETKDDMGAAIVAATQQQLYSLIQQTATGKTQVVNDIVTDNDKYKNVDNVSFDVEKGMILKIGGEEYDAENIKNASSKIQKEYNDLQSETAQQYNKKLQADSAMGRASEAGADIAQVEEYAKYLEETDAKYKNNIEDARRYAAECAEMNIGIKELSESLETNKEA